jgi:hypothetical protein
MRFPGGSQIPSQDSEHEQQQKRKKKMEKRMQFTMMHAASGEILIGKTGRHFTCRL